MTKKYIFVYLVIMILFAGLLLNPALAKKSIGDEQTLPETDGTYDVPGRPDLKVRVFVHSPKAKPPKAKPTPSSSPTPSPICGLSDNDSNAVVNPAGWHVVPGNWTYRLNFNSVPSSVDSSNLSLIAGTAFTQWSTAIGDKVNFVKGANTTKNRAAYDAQNIIAWGKAPGTALAVTYTWYNSITKAAVETDTIMNTKFAWSWTNQSISPNCAYANSYDAQDILTHELGHWMGLNDHYTGNYVDNTMYGYGSKAEIKKDTLTTGDISGLQAIYSAL